MHYKGQGAMEYLMTYGWAILVVMVVGLILYGAGVFDIGRQVAITSSGFSQLKPLLPSCKMSRPNAWYSGGKGFSCQFVNAEAREIYVTNLNFTVNGGYCGYMFLDILPRFTSGKSAYIYRSCTEGGVCSTTPRCIDTTGTGKCMPGSQPPLTVSKDLPFTIVTYSYDTGTQGRCEEITPGEPYVIYVDIEYETRLMGTTVVEHSRGRISLGAE